MRVFVAGASGVVGRRLLPMLREAGHDVTGMTRSEARAEAIRAAGATPAICDVFDETATCEAVERSRPDAVVHQLTDLPQDLKPRGLEKAYAANDRIRREGTRNLVKAAVSAGARRLIAQSLAFAYAPSGPSVVDEEHPLWLDAPAPFGGAVAAVDELERAVLDPQVEALEGIVLRYGFFYGPRTSYASDGYIAGEVRRRRFPRVGRGEGVFSFTHVDDAAGATVAGLDRGRPGAYNIVDDDPAPMSEWLPYYATALGAKPPLRVPKLVARLVGGEYAVMLATELRGASNARAKRELAWEPRHASWRVGFRDALG